jgi:predicted DNA binding CopG/RHH family protein
MKRSMKIKAADFDKAFEKGDVSRFLDKSKLKTYNTIQRINVDIPKEMLHNVDQEAARIGVPRTSLIKMWIAERLAHSAV